MGTTQHRRTRQHPGYTRRGTIMELQIFHRPGTGEGRSHGHLPGYMSDSAPGPKRLLQVEDEKLFPAFNLALVLVFLRRSGLAALLSGTRELEQCKILATRLHKAAPKPAKNSS